MKLCKLCKYLSKNNDDHLLDMCIRPNNIFDIKTGIPKPYIQYVNIERRAINSEEGHCGVRGVFFVKNEEEDKF